MLEGFLIVCTVFQAQVYIRSFLDKDFAAKCLNLDTFDCEILERLWQVSECVRDGSRTQEDFRYGLKVKFVILIYVTILMCNLI